MSGTTYTAKEAGALLAAYGLDAREATGRVRRWRMDGILPPAGRDRGGKLAAFRFERAQVAAAAILFWLHDHAGITRHDHLRGLYDQLTLPRPGGDTAQIDLILGDIERDGTPALLVTRWANPAGEVATSFTVILSHEFDWPIVAPGDEWEPIQDGALSLAPLLDSFTAPVVVPFPTAGNA